QTTDKCRFPAAGRTDNGCGLLAWNLQVDIEERLLASEPGIELVDVNRCAHLTGSLNCAAAGNPPKDDDRNHNDSNQHQRTRPRLAMRLVVRTVRIGKYLQGQSGGGLVGLPIPELVAKGGEH